MGGIQGQAVFEWLRSGGFAMYPLLLCSFSVWVIIFERLWHYRRLRRELKAFHLEALNAILRGGMSGNSASDWERLRSLCVRHSRLPTAQLLTEALERLTTSDERLRKKWQDHLERRRQLLNQELRGQLWILGTIGSSAPFIGLFGTVVGILRSFHEMAKTGSGGFAVVASGISESLIATAAGIVVAVVAVMAYNTFQTRWNSLVLMIKLHTEELAEMLECMSGETPCGS